MRTEVLIVIGLFGFYLYDAIVLLRPREMVLACTGRRYALSSPYPYLTVRHRIPWMPNPLRPDRMLFRLTWSDDGTGNRGQSLADAQALVAPLGGLRIATLLAAVALLIALPWLALTFGIGLYFLYGIAAAYALIVAMLALTWRDRAALGLSTRDLMALAFDALACPPFAINLVRKLGLRRTLAIDPLEIAATRLPRSDASHLWRAIKRGLDDELMQLQDDSERAVRLRAFYADLEGKMST